MSDKEALYEIVHMVDDFVNNAGGELPMNFIYVMPCLNNRK